MRDIVLLDLHSEAGFMYRMRDIVLLDLRSEAGFTFALQRTKINSTQSPGHNPA